MSTKTKPAAKNTLIPVLVTTAHRGVFFGHLKPADMAKRTIALKDARMAIYWGTDKGVMQLAATGPTSKSRIGAKADVPVLHDVTGIFAVSAEAVEKWLSA